MSSFISATVKQHGTAGVFSWPAVKLALSAIDAYGGGARPFCYSHAKPVDYFARCVVGSSVMESGELILYQTEDGSTEVSLRASEGTVWLTQLEMADLFNTSKQSISLHLQNVFADQELSEISVVKDSLTTAVDGKNYQVKLYNLDAILAVGFRVRSPRGVQFRHSHPHS